MSRLLEVRGLTIGHGDRILYRDVSFDICAGDCIMLCGANGSGKTTLMRMLSSSCTDAIQPQLEGLEIVMIPARIPKVKGFTLKEFIRTSCYRQSDMGGHLSQDQEISLNKAMSRLGLSDLADRDISTLSDGEFQKAGIAAALVRKASIIMLDEPTAFLDAENRIAVLSTLKTICHPEENVEYDHIAPAIIFSTHDLQDGLAVASKVIALGADKTFRCTSESKEEAVSTIFHKK